MHLECHNLLFCKRKYEYVFYGVRLIRMTVSHLLYQKNLKN